MNLSISQNDQINTLRHDLKEMSKRIKRLQSDLKTVKQSVSRGTYDSKPDMYSTHLSILRQQLEDLSGHAYGFGQVVMEAASNGRTDEGNDLQTIVLQLIKTR